MLKKFVASLGLAAGFLPMLFLPVLVFAQQGFAPGTIGGVLGTIGRLLNFIIPILIALAVVYFIWGVIQYVTAKDEEKQKESRKVMISGIIGLFVIVSIWGIIGLLTNTFGITTGGGPSGIPQVPIFP